MKPRGLLITSCFMMVCLLRCLIAPSPVASAVLYKRYIVRQDGGVDILCDPYVVQNNDYVFKLFRQRGEIAEKDFPEFLEIFKRLNPQVPNVNQILPGQHIYIPLKKLARDTLLDQASGVVTIPFVTISNLYEFIKNYSNQHTVQNGEFISRLIAQKFGNYGTSSYEQGAALFKILNPTLKDPNRIFPGQRILLPDPSLRNQPWYSSLFDSSGRLSADFQYRTTTEPAPATPQPLVAKDTDEKPSSPFNKVAQILNGKLLQRGVYYFPRKGAADFKLDLSRSPIIELKEGIRILFLKDQMVTADLNLIESFWKNKDLIPVSSQGSMEEIFDSVFGKMEQNPKKQVSFTDRGLEVDVQARWILARPDQDNKGTRYICINLIEHPNERTPDSVSGYLEKKGIIVEDILHQNPTDGDTLQGFQEENSAEDIIPINALNPKAFVKNLLMALGARYVENVKITFPYVGIQVEATANLISTHHGKDLFVDFEDLYGDAIRTIEKTGVTIIQIKKQNSLRQIIEKLLTAMEENYTVDPTFFASKRPEAFNTAMTIPGFLLEKKGYPNKTLLAAVPLHTGIIEFLKKQGVNVILIKSGHDRRRIG